MKKFLSFLILLLTITLTACGTPKALYYPGFQTTTGYKSTYFGFTFTTPSGYYLLSRERLIQETKMPLDANSPTYAEDAIEYGKDNLVFEMDALHTTTGSNVMVGCFPYKPTDGDINNDTEFFKTHLPQFMGVPVTQSDKTTEIAGKEYLSFTLTTNESYGALHHEIFVNTLEDKMVLIIISWLDGQEGARETLLNAFSDIDSE
ncbi:MAG: hypothetical protein E7291_04280 [Lachnospiraceae bacterium]|nr:hypothetical protein [Lachnospiraceae bacterium]